MHQQKTVTITLPKPHAKQLEIIKNPSRFLVVSCGRRFGKTTAGKIRIIRKALAGGRCWWLAPSYDNAVGTWRSIKSILAPLPDLQISESLREVILPTGGSIAVKSAGTNENLRGDGIDYAVFDETAFISGEVWTAVVRPMLITSEGGALFLSTPYGRNWFYDLYTKALDDPQWASVTYTTYDNPLINPAEIDASKNDMTERQFREEIMAEFVDASGSVFRRIKEAVHHETPTSNPPKSSYVIGVDLAKSQDYTVFTVLDAKTKRVIEIERFNSVEYLVQIERLDALRRRYHDALCVIESNIEATFIELAYRRNMKIREFRTTNISKGEIISALALAFEQSAITIPDEPTLIKELLDFEIVRTKTGIGYSAPSGKHDDCVMSLAFAWFGAMEIGGGASWI